MEIEQPDESELPLSSSNVVIEASRPASLVAFENMLQTHILHYESVHGVYVDGISIRRNSSGSTKVWATVSKRIDD